MGAAPLGTDTVHADHGAVGVAFTHSNFKRFQVQIADTLLVGKNRNAHTVCFLIVERIVLNINKHPFFLRAAHRRCAHFSGKKTDFLYRLLQAFYAHALSHRMIQIHSSLIRFHGEGLMFIGPSGIGKTTQAELWQTYRNSDIINGDMVFIQQTTDRFIGWGTPWHGSSPYCMNTNVPIKAVIVLQQDSRNQIRRLHGFEKVTALSRNIIFPQWLPDGTQKCLDILNPFVQYIPVYELSCRPDEDAIQMTEDVIFS